MKPMSRQKGLPLWRKSFSSLKRAKPATKLVFMEDLVATLRWNHCDYWDLTFLFCRMACCRRIASIVIGLMMFYVVGRVFLDNAKGALGEADDDLEAEDCPIYIQKSRN